MRWSGLRQDGQDPTWRSDGTLAAAFKAQVAEDALRGDRSVRQIARKHGGHPNQASQQERKGSEKLVELFERRPKAGPEPQGRLMALAR